MAVVAVAITVACSSGAGKSTVKVAPTPNSEASKTGPQVLADAARAVATVPTIHVVGSEPGDPTSKIDLRIQTDGGVGTETGASGSFQIMLVKGQIYLKSSQGTLPSLGASQSVPKALAGKWVIMDGLAGFADSAPLTPKGLSSSLGQLDDGITVDRAVMSETVGGHKTVVVRESDGSRLYVAATGEPLPLKIVTNSQSGGGLASAGNVTFTYGEDPVQLRAPTGAVAMPTFALPTSFPSGLPSDFPIPFPSVLPTAFPSGFPTALESELRSLAAAHRVDTGGAATPTPTP